MAIIAAITLTISIVRFAIATGCAEAQSAPLASLRHGPALAYGYEYAPTGLAGLTVAWERLDPDGGSDRDTGAAELVIDTRLPGAGRWMLRGRRPLHHTWFTDTREREDGAVEVGNLGLTLTRIAETSYSAESFIGLLVPSFSVGLVLPVGTRTDARPDMLLAPDAIALHRPDAVALSAATSVADCTS